MKTTYRRIYLLVVVCSLKAITSFAQPIIKVPPMCEVVVAGTGLGASTGYGGAVGDGGIVVMPDPFDYPREEGNFYYASNEFELVQWELFGDLSMQTDTYFNEVLQPVGSINPVNIQSYNKNLRFGEMPSASQPNLNPRWARSKGRIVVTYYDKRCSSKIKFDVYKRYKSDKEKNLVPPVLGPDCVVPNTVYTFSVDPIASDNPNDQIGFDYYYWSGLPEGCTLLYNSPDNSSITIKTGERVASFTIQCCYGRANDWDGESSLTNHTTCVTKSISSTLLNPEYIVAPPSCHPTGGASFTFTYTNPVTTYTWAAPNTGWTIGTPVVGPTNTTITVTTPNNNPGTLSLTINGVCQPVTINYQIDRSLAAPLVVAPSSPTTSTCINLGGSGAYTISPNASANPVIWSTSPASITGVTLSNANSSTATVTIASNTTVGSFSLEARSSIAACNASFISTVIYVCPAAPTITGPTPACITRGTMNTTAISCNAVAGATGYSWNLTGAPGWSIFANGNTVNPTFTPNGTTAGPITLTVTALGVSGVTCDSNPSAAYTVTYSPVAPAINAITCWNTSVPLAGSSVMPNKTLTINNLQNFGTYSVDANPALFSSASLSGSTITLVNPVFLSTGTYSLTVRHTNGTCTAAATTLTITVTAVTVTAPVMAVSFNGPNGIVDNYTHSAAATGPVAFAGWFVNNATVVTNGLTVSIVLNQLSLGGSTAPTSVGIYVNDNGCFKRVFSPTVGTKSASRQSNPNTSPIKGIVISPNPNNGTFSITALDFKDSATAILYDMNGRVVATAVLNKGENKIEKEGLAKGTYIVSLLVDGKTEARKIIIK